MTTAIAARGEPHLAYFEDMPRGRRLRRDRLVATVAVSSVLPHARIVNRARLRGIPISADEVRRLHLRRMFVAGAAAGFLASRYTNPRVWQPTFHLLHGRFCALWSNWLIAADAAMDEQHLDRRDSLDLLGRGLLAAFSGSARPAAGDLPAALAADFGRLIGQPLAIPPSGLYYPFEPRFRFENFSILLAVELGRVLAELRAAYASRTPAGVYACQIGEFRRRFLELVYGQVRSLELARLDDDHDMGWYIEVLDGRFMNVLLAPPALFMALGEAERRREQRLERCFLLTNQLFFHRQVLDDLLDLGADTEEGLAGTLHYLIVSQGRLAERLERLAAPRAMAELPAEARREVVGEVARSWLLPPHAWAWRQWRAEAGCGAAEIAAVDGARLGSEQLARLLTYALVNRPEELARPPEDLARQAGERKRRLLAAWKRRSGAEVLAIVRESAVARRILDSIADPRNVAEVQAGLEALGDDRLKEVVGYFYERTRRTYQRVLEACAEA
jgi:hypothetical protein